MTYDFIRSNAVKALLSYFSPLDNRKELHFPPLYLLLKLPLPEGRMGTAWEPTDPNIFPIPL
jgi:hypothetical protein